MKENDYNFINSVVDYYYSTVDQSHPKGNMSDVAQHFGITRPKVNKILITANVIDSPLHRDIMRLKKEGYDTNDISLALGVSATTVKINMPYEKVIYNGEEKSLGAQYIDSFREREKIFLSNVVRKKTDLEKESEAFCNNPKNAQIVKQIERQLQSLKEKLEDDPIHLMPIFTEEERKLFKIYFDLVVLHVELDADLSEVKKQAQIEHGNTISRDILVPCSMPLHNLHYVINQAFGFTNSHLHQYTLSDEDFKWITQKDVNRYKKLIGLIFKNPYRDEDLDFWDDDYEGGSPKKWMRSKYTGPYYAIVDEESYWYIQDSIRDKKTKLKSIENIGSEFYFNPMAVNEVLSVGDVLSVNGHKEFNSFKEYNEFMEESLKKATQYPRDSIFSIPVVAPFTEKIYYNYDFGDDWNFIITLHEDVEYLKGRVSAQEMKEAIKNVLTLARPIVIAADGLPLVENVGGPYGFMEFIKGEGPYENKAASFAWARSNGWPGKIGNLKTLL